MYCCCDFFLEGGGGQHSKRLRASCCREEGLSGAAKVAGYPARTFRWKSSAARLDLVTRQGFLKTLLMI